jgi:ATP-dependent DNA ligase
VYELKMDGFRALAHLSVDGVRLVSRRRNTYKSFPRLCATINSTIACDAVLDGEIVCLDSHGRPQFYELLRRRGDPVFYAFDLLSCDGKDLRERCGTMDRSTRFRSTSGSAPRACCTPTISSAPAWSSSDGCVNRIWKGWWRS